MKKVFFSLLIGSIALGFTAFSTMDKAKSEKQEVNSTKPSTMNNYLSIFEIPATDISRAIEFYHEILQLDIEKVEMPGMEMIKLLQESL